MKCPYCSKPIRVWQSKKPMGPGPMPLYGQYEHTECHEKRAESIAKIRETFTPRQKAISDETTADLYERATR
jgi:hypothetical protein